MKNYAIILAAGNGSRMKVDVPKCVHQIIRKPMIQYVYESIDDLLINKTLVVISENHLDTFSSVLPSSVEFVIQKNQIGTGDAVYQSLSHIKNLLGYTLILPGDMPLVNKDELNALIK